MGSEVEREERAGFASLCFSAGAPPNSLLGGLTGCSNCSAGQGEAGGHWRRAGGTQLLRGQWLQAVRGKGGAAPGVGRGKRLQPSRAQRPSLWVGGGAGGPRGR